MPKECKVRLKIDTSKMRASMQAMVDKYKEDGSIIDVLKFLAQRTYLPNHRERIFIEWLCDNIGDLEAAIKDLDLEVEEGPDFVGRLKDEVMSVLQPGVVVIHLDDLLERSSDELRLSCVVNTRHELVKYDVKES